ncbi:hypothetical protein Droror1_Dr00006981 [Drosera rotundifolia]
MESAGTIMQGGEWSSFDEMYANEEADFMAQLFPNCSVMNDLDGVSSLRVASTCWDGHYTHFDVGGVENFIYSSDSPNSNSYSFSQESTLGGGGTMIFATSGPENFYMSDSSPFFGNSTNPAPISFSLMNANNNFILVFPDKVDGDDSMVQEISGGNMDEPAMNPTEAEAADEQVLLGGEVEVSKMGLTREDNSSDSMDTSRKRSRSSAMQKGKRAVKSKKKKNLAINEEEHNGVLDGHSSSGYSSEDDSNASQEPSGRDTSSLSSKVTTALNSNGKTRASRGSATDPQSLYARRRRERINERLKILQSLVPNGTKVDISTMLEEAVEYVKFLQLQIKLLSSDDMWMYAPIAYNGMDIGLDLKLNMPR